MFVEELKQFGIDAPDDGLVILDCFTRWCGPCRTLTPTLEHLSEEGLFHLRKVDLDENRDIGQVFGINAVPTLIFFKDGKILEKNISIEGRTLVQDGMMVGTAGELVLRELIDQM